MFDMGDDGVEPEGACINLRYWRNTFINILNPVSLAPITVGPVYVWRNIQYNHHEGAYKVSNDTDGPVFEYNNTVITTIPETNGIQASGPWENLHFRNNIISATAEFNLAPGETRTVKARWPKESIPSIPSGATQRHGCILAEIYNPEDLLLDDIEEVKQHMNEQGMAVFQWPERLEVVPGWPLTAVNKINKRLLRAYITTKLLQEEEIDKELADEFLKRDKLAVDDILTGKVRIDFAGKPS